MNFLKNSQENYFVKENEENLRFFEIIFFDNWIFKIWQTCAKAAPEVTLFHVPTQC